MTDDVQIGEGDVIVILNGSEEVLRPTWEAAYKLSQIAGGLYKLQNACGLADMEALALTLSIGMGVKLNDSFRERVYLSGTWGLTLPCQTFIANVSNGGRPLKPVEGDSKDPQPKA